MKGNVLVLIALCLTLVIHFVWYTTNKGEAFGNLGILDSVVRFEKSSCVETQPDSRLQEQSATENLSWVIYTVPKPPQAAPKQETALYSWIKVQNPPTKIYILQAPDFTDEEVKKLKKKIPQIETIKTGFGSKMKVDSIFELASREPVDAVVYMNADIVIFDDFTSALANVAAKFPRFFMVGCQSDSPLDINVPQWSDLDAGWLTAMKSSVNRSVLHTYGGSDYFAWRPRSGRSSFTTAIGSRIPPFSIGWPKVVALFGKMKHIEVKIDHLGFNHDVFHAHNTTTRCTTGSSTVRSRWTASPWWMQPPLSPPFI
jgi:hypothetical protein